MEVDSVPTMKAFCASGLGLAYLPMYAIEEEKEKGILGCLPLCPDEGEQMATQLLGHRDRVLTPAVTELCGILAELLEDTVRQG